MFFNILSSFFDNLFWHHVMSGSIDVFKLLVFAVRQTKTPKMLNLRWYKIKKSSKFPHFVKQETECLAFFLINRFLKTWNHNTITNLNAVAIIATMLLLKSLSTSRLILMETSLNYEGTCTQLCVWQGVINPHPGLFVRCCQKIHIYILGKLYLVNLKLA